MKLELSDDEANEVYDFLGHSTGPKLWHVYRRLLALIEAGKEKQEKLNSLRAKHKQLLGMQVQTAANIANVLAELDTLEKVG